MEFEQLVAEITRQVTKALSVNKSGNLLMVCHDENNQYTKETARRYGEHYVITYSCRLTGQTDFITGFDHYLVPFLTAQEIGRLSSGVAITAMEDLILFLLMRNKTIVVTHNALENTDIEINPVLHVTMLAHIEKLKQYGVLFSSSLPENGINRQGIVINWIDKRLIAEKDVLALDPGAVIKIGQTLITPSAKDVIRKKKITVCVTSEK